VGVRTRYATLTEMEGIPEKGRDATRLGRTIGPDGRNYLGGVPCTVLLAPNPKVLRLHQFGTLTQVYSPSVGSTALCLWRGWVPAPIGTIVSTATSAHLSWRDSASWGTVPPAVDLVCGRGRGEHPERGSECRMPESPAAQRSEQPGTEAGAKRRPCSLRQGSDRARVPVTAGESHV